MERLLEQVTAYANAHYDGHFTLMKFTTNWRACYGTIRHWTEIDQMPKGFTMEEALQALLENPINADQMQMNEE